MINKVVYKFTASSGVQLHADLYTATNNRKNTTIVYLHGGGLLYGVRDDLPQIYLELFLANGYDLLALDYPLAPESNLDDILTTVQEELNFYLNDNCAALGLNNPRYILFGRSAGAYLAFMSAARMQESALPTIALICLYGYSGFGHPQFSQPSKHYSKLAAVTDEQAKKIIADEPIVYGPLNERFALYIKARQDGNWAEYLGVDINSAQYSLSAEQLKQLPPLIMAAATLDPDVPYKISKDISKQLVGSKLITVYEQEHDFDRDTGKPIGKQVYKEIIDWLG